MKATNFLRAGLMLALGALVGAVAVAKEPTDKNKKGAQPLLKTAGTPIYAVLDINNITTWTRYDGHSNHSPQGDDGSYYPRGTGSFIYQDCLVWGGKMFKDAAYSIPYSATPTNYNVRVGGGTYGIGTKAGKIVNPALGPAGIENTNNADVRIYRIRRDYATMTKDDYTRDAAAVNEVRETDVTDSQRDAVKAQYALDWANWPVAKGAPFIDRNGNGVYDGATNPAFNTDPLAGPLFTPDSLISRGLDEPGVAGGDVNSPADQVIWTVYNDLNETQALGFEGSPPVGLEVQKTIWGYKRSDALGNLWFTRYQLINKGGVDIDDGAATTYGAFYIDSMYVCQWSDPDLGQAGDDLLGCDTVLSMGFVYNGNAVDDEYRLFNLAPPAAGYDFLAGPLVTAPGDSAVFKLSRRYNVKNMGMTSFAYFSAGSPYTDPPGGASNYLPGTGQWWKMLRGFAPLGNLTTADQPYAFPTGQTASKFPLNGDPVTQSGWIDGAGEDWSFPPGDRRLLVQTGPFRMAPGDTQEVYVGTVVGLGSDRLSSVAVMKFNDRFVQNTFNALFVVPKPPPPPNTVVAELDGKIILDWGSDLVRVNDIETKISNPGQYVFEGYNVYQMPLRGSRLSEAKRIATFDLPTDPTVILDLQFDQTSGQILDIPVQYGSNSGISRNFVFDRDYVQDINKLSNGQEYYLVVTAYSRATTPGYLPAALESDPVVLTARPKVPFGKEYATKYGDVIPVTHVSGVSDGVVSPNVVDPTRSNGKTYRVGFDTTGGSVTWYLRNVTDNTLILSGQTNLTGDDNYKMVEGGVYLKVSGPTTPGLKAGAWGLGDGSSFNTGTRNMSWANGDGLGLEDFNGAAGWINPANYFNGIPMVIGPDQLVGIVIKFTKHATSTVDSTGGALFDKTDDDSASYAYRYLRGATAPPARSFFAPWIVNAAGGYIIQDYRISAPLTVYNTDQNPPQRLAVGYLENNSANGLVDGYYYPGNQGNMTGADNNTSGTGPREWLFVFKSAYTGATQNTAWQNVLADGSIPIMYMFTWNRRNNNAWVGNESVTFTPNRLNQIADVFEYTLPAAQAGTALEKVSADKVGVFPNPYYAFNSAETNRFNRFVTFNNLPPKAKIRIFNLAGQLVKTIDKDDTAQFSRWDLTNYASFPVASGMYVAHLELTLPSDGSVVTKVLKIAVIQEQEILNNF